MPLIADVTADIAGRPLRARTGQDKPALWRRVALALNCLVMGGDDRFWLFFGSAWLLVGGGFITASLAAMLFVEPAALNKPALVWEFLLVGLVVCVVGGIILHRTRVVAARDQDLMQSGVPLTATVPDIRRSAIRINRRSRWHVRCRYEYSVGYPLEGESRALPPDAVQNFCPGDKVRIKVDPRRPEESVFLGAE